MKLFFAFMALESLAANFAHPITPTLIKQLALPDYAFGVLFAGMAFTNFLFSPLWAKQVRKLGSKKVLGICCVGYGFGQAMFALMKTLPTILCARLLSGFFVG
ncbi:MAG: MFS transporter, partial [Erysipelotrichia bacterium]|nr:MFS transporter [Erysipelotrichia bacterium]